MSAAAPPLDKQIEAMLERITDVRDRFVDLCREFVETSAEAERIGKLVMANDPSRAVEIATMLLDLRTSTVAVRQFGEKLAKVGG